ncbi:MAG: MoaD/ThiS family protein [Planctomycetaceae bacterium]
MIRVEFYGIPRSRAGIEALDVHEGSLSEVLRTLGERLPRFADDCLDGSDLRSGFLACINGKQFTTDGGQTLHDGDSLLILSADVGG